MISLSKLALVALALLPAAPALSATTYRVELTQDGLGDAGPDWFGSVTVATPSVQSDVDSFSITVNGVTYDSVLWPTVPLIWVAPGQYGPTPHLFGIASPKLFSGTPLHVLWFGYAGDAPDFENVWTIGECYTTPAYYMFCLSGDFPEGNTVRLIEETAAVPLPATGALALAGIGGLAALRRRRS